MNLHEYQSKELLKKWKIPIPEFGVASNEKEATQIVEKLGLSEGIVKIQVHAGGRGKAGGVKFAKSKSEIIEQSKKLIGMKIVNNQTGAHGIIANQVLISKPVDIDKEYYIGAIIDRDRGVPTLIVSPEGGMEIEEIAKEKPDKILTIPFSFDGTLRSYHVVQLVKFMGWKGDTAKQGAVIAKGLAKAFIHYDASLLEINPLVMTPQKKLYAVDAKLSIDENAIFRQPEIAAYYDPTQLSEAEASAKEFDLAYVAMDGEIGCMVNGAGLAMATMDIIKLYGKSPANFLDVGGGASKNKVAAGFRIILSDPKVKAILVNIFGGIMNCATLAEGVLQAAEQLDINVPLVVRMEGTNVEEGKQLLADSGLSITTADDLTAAAEKVVEAVKRGKR